MRAVDFLITLHADDKRAADDSYAFSIATPLTRRARQSARQRAMI